MAKEASLDDCLKLLTGDSDERRLVGLLLAAKFVKGDDTDAVRQVFDAIGFQFINRLLKTGSGQAGGGQDKRQYLHLALSILAAFCRLPELASSDETITKVPTFVTTLGTKQDEAAAGDCYECLLAVSVSSERGIQSLLECSNAVTVIVHQLHDSAPDAPWFPVALKLLHCIIEKVARENRTGEHAQDLAYAISAVATQLGFRQDTVKFEALSILYSLLVSDISGPIRTALGVSIPHSQWPAQARTGLGQILHSRVAIEQKYLVLELAESIVELLGETWLVGSIELPGQQAPRDRFFLLLVETVRVETAVLLNEVAQTAFGGSGERIEAAETSKKAEGVSLKQRRLMKCFALIEHVITVVATQEESSTEMHETTQQKTLVALDEAVGIVLEFLEDAQRQNQRQGDVLMASVRIVSRYLAEAPFAHQERCHKLLSFLLSISPSGQSRPFLAVQFMLPYLTQITLDSKGCKILLASGSHIQIVRFLSWAVLNTQEASSCLVDICDVLLNILTKTLELKDGIIVGDFIPVIPALVAWVGQGLTRMENAMVASVLTSVLALTDEDHLRKSPHVGPGGLRTVSQVIISNLEVSVKGVGRSGEQADEDLLEIMLSLLVACIDRYPAFKLELRAQVQHVVGKEGLSHIQGVTTNPSLQQLLITVLTP